MKRLLVLGLILLALVGTVSATNILLNSSEFNATIWTKHNTNTLMENDTVATTDPLGTNTADRIRFLGASSDDYYIAQPAYIVNGQEYTFKFDVKPYDSAFYIVQLTGGSAGYGTGQWANYNVSSCAVTYSTGGTATAVSNGSGWCTIGWTVPAIATGSLTSPALFATNNNSMATRAPSYTTATSTYLYLWGGSMENTTGGPPDTTPPLSITGLTNASTSSTGINFEWDNPVSDFDHVMIWKDGVFFHNVTTAYDYWTGLTPLTAYTISTKTVDALGNVNTTFVNLSVTTTDTVVYSAIFNTTNSSDGSVSAYNTTGSSYYGLRNSGGMTAYTTDVSGKGTRLIANQTGMTGYQLDRGVFGFDTSSLPDDATILTANFSVVATGAGNQVSQLGAATYAITQYTPHTPGSIVYQYDYSNISPYMYSDVNITPVASTRNGWPFNAAGIANISKTGWTGIMMRQVPWDMDNDTTGLVWVDGSTRNKTQFDYYMSEAGGSYVPQLTITYTSSGSEIPSEPVSSAVSFSPTNTTHKTAYGVGTETFTATVNTTALPGTLSYSWIMTNVTGDNVPHIFNTTAFNPRQNFTPGNYSIVVNVSNGINWSSTPENVNFVNVTQWDQDAADALPLSPTNHIFRQNIASLPVESRSAGWITAISSYGGGVYPFKPYASRPIMYVGNDADFQNFLFDINIAVRPPDRVPYPLPEDYRMEISSSDSKMSIVNRDSRMAYDLVQLNTSGHPYGRYPNGSYVAGVGIAYSLDNLTMHSPAGYSPTLVTGMTDTPLLFSRADVESGSLDHAVGFGLIAVGASGSTDYLWPAHATATTGLINSSFPKHGARIRLKSTYDVDNPAYGYTTAQKILLRGLQTYGGIFSITGSYGIGVNAETGALTPAEISGFTLAKLPVSSFEFVDESSLMVNSNSYAVNATIAPTAAFHANVTSASTTTTVPIQFTDDSATIGATYQWAYQAAGEAWTAFSTEQNPTYNFIPGVYSINQTVTNTAGTDSEIKTSYITITGGIAPVSHFYMNLSSAVPEEVYGAESFNSTSNPIGGGAGYTDTFSLADADYIVTSVSSLQTAMASAHSGDVVYVNPAYTINLSGYQAITIPSGVTLASNRGVGGSSGALIIKKTGYAPSWGWEQPMFKTTGVDVRVTGLRLEGEYLAQDGTGPGEAKYLVGLEAETATDFEVDNCELYGWAWSAVSLDRSSNSYIHNNYIHHNQAAGEGYGTSLYEGSALIERNLYSYNRHDITGDGNGNEQYTFRYNIDQGTGSASGGSRTDVHEGTGGYAGSTFNISYNTFKASGSNQLLLPIQVSEKPLVDMTISHNVFEGTTIMGGGYYTAPVRQLVDATFGNLTVTDNYWKNVLYPTDSGIVMYEVR